MEAVNLAKEHLACVKDNEYIFCRSNKNKGIEKISI